MRAFGLLFFGIVCIGCGTKIPGITQQVGADGGVVSGASGVAIVVPPGALSSTTEIVIETGSPAALTDSTAVGTTFVFGPEGTTFAAPVTVTLPFSADELPDGATGADVEIFTAPQDSTDFVSLGGTLADSTHVVASTTHFSIFVAGVKKHGGNSPDDGGTDGGTTDAGVSDAGSDAGTDAGTNTCGPGNCNGCCLSDGGCYTSGVSINACGYNGAACVNCGALQPPKQCVAQPHPYCL